MNKIFLKSSLIAAAFTLSACYAGDVKKAAAGHAAAYDKAMAEAIAAADKAKSVGGEWRDIRWKKSKKPLILNAEKAAAKGDYAKAISLLKTAKFQGEMGYQQAMEQKNAGPRF